MRIIIVRHGETVANAKGIIQGQQQGRLSLKGKRQAQQLALRLEKEPIDIVYCSDLRRCKQTLAPLLALKSLRVRYSRSLREKSSGRFEGRTLRELQAWRKDRMPDFVNPVPGGESYKDIERRISLWLQRLPRADNILVMTHGTPIISLLLKLLRKTTREYDKFKVDNTGVCILHLGKKNRLVLHNCTKHLNVS